jgi:hypothetical protein
MSDNFDISLKSRAFNYVGVAKGDNNPQCTTSNGRPQKRGTRPQRNKRRTNEAHRITNAIRTRPSVATSSAHPRRTNSAPTGISSVPAHVETAAKSAAPHPESDGERRASACRVRRICSKNTVPEVAPTYESKRAPAAHRIQIRSTTRSAPGTLVPAPQIAYSTAKIRNAPIQAKSVSSGHGRIQHNPTSFPDPKKWSTVDHSSAVT